MTDTDKRTAYLMGLRTLLYALESNPDLPLPHYGQYSAMPVFTKTKAEVAAYARLMGKATKNVRDDSESYGFELTGSLDGLSLLVYAPREEVCTRVVTGTTEVTREVPAPGFEAEPVPMVTVTETVETVEWVCTPILSEARA